MIYFDCDCLLGLMQYSVGMTVCCVIVGLWEKTTMWTNLNEKRQNFRLTFMTHLSPMITQQDFILIVKTETIKNNQYLPC